MGRGAAHEVAALRRRAAPDTDARGARDGQQPHWPAEPGEDNLFPGRPVAYGFGWFLDPWQGRPRMWHHGETRGFRSVVERFTRDAVSVVILANRDDLDLRTLATKLVEN